MIVLSFEHKDFAKWRARLNRRAIPNPKISQTVAGILEEVRTGGDAALRRFTEQFDHVTLRSFALPGPAPKPSAKIVTALKHAHRNIATFAAHRIPKNWRTRNAEKASVGEVYRPFDRVGIYVPGGSVPLVSTALMTITLAAAAKCPEIVVVTPPPVDPVLHYAIHMAGASEIYQLGGAQAIGALAFGTKTIRPVQKIFGPGNAYVTEAKRQVVGAVAIDQLPGPSEAMVIADESAEPTWIAGDLLAQAEHGPDSSAVLLTPSEEILGRCRAEMERLLDTLSRKHILAKSLKNCAALVRTKDLDQAVEIANDFAPEHLSLQCADARRIAGSIKAAGAIFIGGFSPIVAGDFVAGPSHTLPTGGAAKSFSGLTVDQFFRRTSVIEYDRKSLAKALPAILRFSQIEELDAHGVSAWVRFSSDESEAS